MSNLMKSGIGFVFLCFTATLSSLPAQSILPSALMNDYCTNTPYHHKNQPTGTWPTSFFTTAKPTGAAFIGGWTSLDVIFENKNCKQCRNIRVRGWFYSRCPVPSVFLLESFAENTSDEETCFFYSEKNRHTVLAEIDMTTFLTER